MFRDFRHGDVDLVADVLHLLEARLQDADLPGHLALAFAIQRQERRVDVLKF